MKFPAAFLAAAVTLSSGVLASPVPLPLPEAKNVPRPKLPSWSNGIPPTPVLPPIPHFRLHGGSYKPALSSAEYLDGNERHAVDGSGECKCQACKFRTSHQSIDGCDD